MPAHAIASGTISFGLVSVPVKLYAATKSKSVSFNLLHAVCGQRIKQQTFCPACNRVVERGELVKGYEFAREQYVRFTDDELRALEGAASKTIDIAEFVPLETVDPVYFEKAYYLGPDKGGEKAYRLLADAMGQTDRVALATFVMRGKENLVLIRPALRGLMLHTMYFADEVRDFGEVDKGQGVTVRDNELGLALRLIEELTHAEFKPEQYRDEYSDRVLEVVNQKVEGREVTTAGPPEPRAQVIDLMEALKESLGKRTAPSAPEAERKPPVRVARRAAAPADKPAARKAQSAKK
jgi:DNA end-binding protein Ku